MWWIHQVVVGIGRQRPKTKHDTIASTFNLSPPSILLPRKPSKPRNLLPYSLTRNHFQPMCGFNSFKYLFLLRLPKNWGKGEPTYEKSIGRGRSGAGEYIVFDVYFLWLPRDLESGDERNLIIITEATDWALSFLLGLIFNLFFPLFLYFF